MKNTLLVALLTLSVVFNAVLAFYPFNPTTPTAPANASSTAATAQSATSSAPAVPDTVVWTAPKTAQDLPGIVANLRAAGFPPATVRAIVNQLLNERYDPSTLTADQPFWKRNYPGPELVAARQKMQDARTAEYEALLGADARPSAALSPQQRKQRFGDLPDDKIDAISRIEQDYRSIDSLANAEARGDFTVSMEQRRVLEKEKLADLQALLTPEQLEQYQMRNSSSAYSVRRAAAKIDLTEAEYAELYRAKKQFEDQNPQTSTYSAELWAQRTARQQALNEQARATLGESRFYTYLAASDYSYAQVAALSAKHPSVTPAVSYQLYQLQVEAQQAMTATGADRSIPARDRAATTQTLMASYTEKLNSLVSPEVAEAYKKTPGGRMFTSFERAQSTTQPAAK
jgi:hypothetical protein